MGIKARVLVADVQTGVEQQLLSALRAQSHSRAFDFGQYHTLDDVMMGTRVCLVEGLDNCARDNSFVSV